MKKYHNKISRRTFIKVSSAAGGGLLIGRSYSSRSLISSESKIKNKLGLFVRISNDNAITVISPCSEMGQGTHTAHAMIIAEELEVNINNISVETGIPGPKEYFSGSYNQQMTGANDGITNWLIPLSEIGARTRNLLIKAGAKFYGVAVDECHAEEGFVHHKKTNRKTSYGSLVDIASKIKKSAPASDKIFICSLKPGINSSSESLSQLP